MSSKEIAISVSDVSKHYLMFDRPEHRLKQMVVPRLQRAAGMEPRKYYRNFAALERVSFDVPRGETVGIIGRNGSGKSTLLQIVCGTLNPSHGKVTVNGRIAALLELGAGFNPEFSGRENVYLNAAILGLKRHEVDERFDAIASFADIGQFIDQPVKTYSSGMYVRLAFATAINVDPDILVIDEALAVGDEAFRRKCYARIEEIQDRGGTILFVSHGAQTIVQLCSRAILFDGGELILQGDPKIVTGQYQRLINASGDEARKMREEIRAMDAPLLDRPKTISVEEDEAVGLKVTPRQGSASLQENVSGSERYDPGFVSESIIEMGGFGAKISSVEIINRSGVVCNTIVTGKTYTIRYDVNFFQDYLDVAFGFTIRTTTGIVISSAGSSKSKDMVLSSVRAGQKVSVKYDFKCNFLQDVYFITLGCSAMTNEGRIFLHKISDAIPFRVAPDPTRISGGYVDLNARLTISKGEEN